MTLGAARFSDRSIDAADADLIDARIEGAKIIDGKIVDGKVIHARRVHTGIGDHIRLHTEIVGLIGLGLVLLVVFLLR